MIVATFQIDGSFKLRGRGLVVFGDIISGIVSKENFVLFKDQNQQVKLEITSIEFMDNITEKIAKVCLLFYYDNDAQREILEALKVEKQTIMITDA